MPDSSGDPASTAWKRIWTFFHRSSRKVSLAYFLRSSPTPASLADENLARFIFQDRYCKNGRLKHGAFMPCPVDGKTSTYRISGVRSDLIWKMADVFVSGRGKPAIARAEILVVDVHAAGLSVEVDRWPPRHAALGSWPTEKDRQMLIAQQLARDACLVPRSS